MRASASARFGRLCAICFHVPFLKIVRKAVLQLAELFRWSAERAEAQWVASMPPRPFRDKEPTMLWNRLCGNPVSTTIPEEPS